MNMTKELFLFELTQQLNNLPKDERDRTRESRGGQKIPDDKQQRQQHQHDPENIGAPKVEHRPQPAYGAQADVNDCGDKQKNHQYKQYIHNEHIRSPCAERTGFVSLR